MACCVVIGTTEPWNCSLVFLLFVFLFRPNPKDIFGIWYVTMTVVVFFGTFASVSAANVNVFEFVLIFFIFCNF